MKVVSKKNNKSIPRLLIFTLLIIIVIFTFMFAMRQTLIDLSGYVISNIFSTRCDIDSQQDKYTLNGLYNYYAIYDLGEISHSKYIEMALSKGDDYKIEFINEDKSNYIIIGTQNTQNNKYLYLIPKYIWEEGYNKVTVSALRGDDELYVGNVKLHDDVDLTKFSDYDVVDFEIKILDIEIDNGYLKEIAHHRADAYKRLRLLPEDTVYYPAKFSSMGRTAPVNMRLKGGYTDHVIGYKWSFRFNFDNDYFFGMKKFAIHKPVSRSGIFEYLMHSMYKEQGGVGLNYDFAQVVINGDYWGVYAIEQGGDRIVSEDSNHPEGAIMTYERLYKNIRTVYYAQSLFTSEHYTHIKAYSPHRTVEDEKLYQYAQYGADAFNLALEEGTNLEEIIDYEMMAKYLAMCELFHGNHGLNLSNLWIYINPITLKIEPVSHDMLALYGSYIPTTCYRSNSLLRNIFDDPKFMEMYIEYLKEYVKEYDNFIEKYSKDIDNYSYLLNSDNCMKFDYYHGLDEHHEFIENTINAENAIFTLSSLNKNTYLISVDSQSVISVDLQEILVNGEPLDIEFNGRTNRILISKNLIDTSSEITAVYKPLYTNNNESIEKPVMILEDLS